MTENNASGPVENVDAPAAEPTPITTPSQGGVFTRLMAMSKRAKVIAGATVLVLVGGGSAFAYTAYQSPDVVVATALASAASQSHPSYKMDVTVSAGSLNGVGNLDIATSDSGSYISAKIQAAVMAQQLGATLNMVSDKSGDLYLNLADFDSIGQYLTQSGLLPSATYKALKTLLTDKWVKLTKAELDAYSSASSGSSCISDTVANGETLKSMSAELGDKMRANNFVVASKELPAENGNRVFVLGVNAEKLRSFLTAVKTTKYWANLKACSPAIDIADSDIASLTQSKVDQAIKASGLTVTLVAGPMTHNLVRLEFNYSDATGTNTASVKLSPNGDQSSKVVIPKSSISSTELFMAVAGLGG